MSKDVEVVKGRMKLMSSEETKKKLVLESYESGLSANQFAKQRGISPASLSVWRKKYSLDSMEIQETDIDSLKAENEGLKKENLKLKAYIGHKIFQFEGAQLA